MAARATMTKGPARAERRATRRPVLGPASGPSAAGTDTRVVAPRLERHTFTLSDGHRIGLAVCGRGVPLVVVHGFTAEGFLYAQTLHRLVNKGFKVIAIDMAGHGGSQGLPATAARLEDYAELMGRAVDELGIRKAVFAGHSMGGRVVAQLAARRPEVAIAALLIDAIVGDEWDLMVNIFRLNPFLLAGLGIGLVIDTATTVPFARDPGQAAKLLRLAVPTLLRHVVKPWRLIGPGISILRTNGSRSILESLAAAEVPTFVIHGARDYMIPLATGRSAAARANGQLITVAGGTHSWLLKDPEALPAIVSELLEDRLGAAIRGLISAAGARTVDQLEDLFFADGAPILAMSPEVVFEPFDETHRAPRYTWMVEQRSTPRAGVR